MSLQCCRHVRCGAVAGYSSERAAGPRRPQKLRSLLAQPRPETRARPHNALRHGPYRSTTAISREATRCPASTCEGGAQANPTSLPPNRGLLIALGVAACLACRHLPVTAAALPFASSTVAWGKATAGPGLTASAGSAWAGMAAGFLHTLAGADHLAALTPLTVGRHPVASSALGALWGAGHCTGQLILGLCMVLLKERFDQLVPLLDRWGGASVGITLLIIGVLGLRDSLAQPEPAAPALAGAGPGVGAGPPPHAARGLTAEETEAQEVAVAVATRSKSLGSLLATYVTGIVYGLQPDALFVVIPALTLPSRLAAAAYMLSFLVGTVTAMGAYAGIIGATSRAISGTNAALNRKLAAAASLLAAGVGVTILVPCVGPLLG
ncbi:hypothetical protein ACKKBG_A00210 [Auxenochlorella protothecoides x Auxenochlorella symbiontica]